MSTKGNAEFVFVANEFNRKDSCWSGLKLKNH